MEALIGLRVSVVHKVHVLHPALLLRDYVEPDAGEHVDENEQDDRHHQDLEVNLDLLLSVQALHGQVQTIQTQEFEETEKFEESGHKAVA